MESSSYVRDKAVGGERASTEEKLYKLYVSVLRAIASANSR